MRCILPSLLVFLLGWPAASQAEPAKPGPGPRVRVRGLSAAELQGLAAGLSSSDPERRDGAYGALTGLHPESLPGIAERLESLRLQRPEPEKAAAVLTTMRRAVGSRRADDKLDIAPGALAVLASRRDPDTLAMAEPLLLLRSLEAMGGPEAGRQLAPYLTLDGGAWRHEMRLVRARGGLKLLAAMISLRSHPDSVVRKWAQYGVRQLGMQEPAAAVAVEDHQLAAQVVRAYASPLDFGAMPVLVRLVNHDKRQVRQAARWAVGRFGKNAIWQVRELYAELAGRPADKSWSWQRSAEELYLVIDREQIEEAQTKLAEGLKAYVAGDLTTMETLFDQVLAAEPRFASRAAMAPGYAALGARALQADALEAAEDRYRRALRLAPEHQAVASWRAQLEYIGAERALSRGLLDLDGYQRALQQDPQHSAAAAALDRLSGRAKQRLRTHKRLAALGAALLLAFMAVMLLRRPAAAEQEAEA